MEPTDQISAAPFNLDGCFMKVVWTLAIVLLSLIFGLGLLAGVVIAGGLEKLI